MIREFKVEDKDKLIKIIKKGFLIDEADIISELESEDKELIVYDKDGIRGFGYIKISNKETKKYNIKVYVEPQWRRKGIGTEIYKEISKYLEKVKANSLVTEFRVDEDDPTSFYKKLGYKKWFGCHEMHYKGTVQPEVDIEFVPYEDKFYEENAKLGQECFYELRKENDIQPYLCPINDQDREYTLKFKDNIYIAFHNEEIIACIVVNNGYLDGITVKPSYQGKGYGKKVTQFGINKALSQDAKLISLSVVEWNKKAENLYKSLGFEIVQTVHFYRQFGDN